MVALSAFTSWATITPSIFVALRHGETDASFLLDSNPSPALPPSLGTIMLLSVRVTPTIPGTAPSHQVCGPLLQQQWGAHTHFNLHKTFRGFLTFPESLLVGSRVGTLTEASPGAFPLAGGCPVCTHSPLTVTAALGRDRSVTKTASFTGLVIIASSSTCVCSFHFSKEMVHFIYTFPRGLNRYRQESLTDFRSVLSVDTVSLFVLSAFALSLSLSSH